MSTFMMATPVGLGVASEASKHCEKHGKENVEPILTMETTKIGRHETEMAQQLLRRKKYGYDPRSFEFTLAELGFAYASRAGNVNKKPIESDWEGSSNETTQVSRSIG
jgi:hypothetical protein